MAKYRKKPVEVEAFQWTGDVEALRVWCASVSERDFDTFFRSGRVGLFVVTLEGPMMCSRGSWIIRGVAGEFYSCDADIFEATYEAVEG